MRRLLWVLPSVLWLGVAALFAAPPAHACIHIGEGQTISQKAQQLLVVYDDGREDLVIGIGYEAGVAPTSVGMVVPVPTVPDEYEALPPAFMDDLRSWVNLEMRTDSRGLRSRDGMLAAAAAEPDSVVQELPAVRAGPYEIQPLLARGAEAVRGLNEWLTVHELSTIPEEALTYYVERGWTFLVVRVSPEEGQDTLSAEGTLPPLRISFASDRPVIPLKLEAQGAPFEVSVHLITTERLSDEAFEGARQRGFVAAGNSAQRPFPVRSSYPYTSRYRFHAPDLPESIQPVVERLGNQEMFLRVLHAPAFGIGAAEPMGWPEELSVPGVAEGQRLEGTEPGETPEPVAMPEPEGDEGEAAAEGEEAADEEAEAEEAEAESPADVRETPDSCACRVGAPADLRAGWLGLGLLGLILWRRRR